MAEEIDNNLSDKPDINQQDGIGENLTEQDNDSENRTLVYIDGQYRGRMDELLVNKLESTGSCGGTLQETSQIRLKTASGCGHLLHTASETGLACLSCQRLGREPLILCSECAKPDSGNICYFCNAAVCFRCRREKRFIDGEKRVVCKACARSTLMIIRLKKLVKWVLIAAGIVYVVMF